jgi:hypothetical protein
VTRREHLGSGARTRPGWDLLIAETDPSRPDRWRPRRAHPVAALLRLSPIPAPRLRTDPPHDGDRVRSRPALGLHRTCLAPLGAGQCAARRRVCSSAPAFGTFRAAPKPRAERTRTEQTQRRAVTAWPLGRIYSGRHLCQYASSAAAASAHFDQSDPEKESAGPFGALSPSRDVVRAGWPRIPVERPDEREPSRFPLIPEPSKPSARN